MTALAPASALALAPPAGTVVLTISGRVESPNRGTEAAFDMAMLERLPQHHVTTETPWFPTRRKFTGPLVRDVLAEAGAKGGLLRLLALNDYRVDIPAEDVFQHPVVLSRLLDDKPMSVREKGPLFIMYPFDSEPGLRNAVYFSRCAWQLKAIEVR